MGILYKLEHFEGPLDLLLHLIEKNKVSIYDIPIVLITEQYLEYVSQMEKEDLNVVSEFLVMAATLIAIKAKMLLPVEVNEDGEEEDPEGRTGGKAFGVQDVQIHGRGTAGYGRRSRKAVLPGATDSAGGIKI